MRFLVIGGDAAGMSAASRAKRNMPDLDVTVLERTEDVSFSACGMPYNIADPKRDMDDLIVRKAEVFRDRQSIDLRTGHQVDSIQVKERRVTGRNHKGEEFVAAYDKLLIATGASPTVPQLPGFDLPGVMALKHLEDGRKIKGFMSERRVSRVVIVGIGYIGLEMCESLRARGMAVDMIKPGPVFLPWMHPDLSSAVQEELEKNGVGVHLGCPIRRIEETEEGLKVVTVEGDFDCQMVLAATGIAPNSRLAKDAGLGLGPAGAISVDRTLCTSHEDIYAAGDCADAFHVVTGAKVWIPLALRANRAGWAVADNVTGRKVELDGVAGTAVFRVFDLEVARTGLSVKDAEKAGFDPAETVIQSRSRAHAHPGSTTIRVQMVADRKSGRLLGVQMVGREGVAHRVNAPAVALHAGMTVERFSQSDLAYAPPFSPVWDPMLTAANQLLKNM
ncbi:MAG: pyridine nucleotide-disulfide oxidoreductase [Desulfobacteraceae bacterium]|nr:MAG: pyridine nucleotide-disulfide oxidoreductase [Desulfobacteraceae bacterium]